MAISLSASASSIRCLNGEDCVLGSVVPTKQVASFASLRFRFPENSRRIGMECGRLSVSPKPRSFSVVTAAAKKQTYSNLDELLANSEKPVLVDFYATWCGPCQFMVPILNEVSARLKDTIQVVKIDTEKYPSIADKYRIEALPTFIIFKDGKPHDRFEGALTADQLVQQIEDSLKVKQ